MCSIDSMAVKQEIILKNPNRETRYQRHLSENTLIGKSIGNFKKENPLNRGLWAKKDRQSHKDMPGLDLWNLGCLRNSSKCASLTVVIAENLP